MVGGTSSRPTARRFSRTLSTGWVWPVSKISATDAGMNDSSFLACQRLTARQTSKGLTPMGHISSHVEQVTQSQGVSSSRRLSSRPSRIFRTRSRTKSGGEPSAAGHPATQVLQVKQCLMSPQFSTISRQSPAFTFERSIN
ncbi:MAG: hypothetical protein BWX47_02064 [candidate division Hyd24-12 bacterium ADurb.Bin004]|nr:MAG: hypothetical protein BWX47_02064 [candidate division Hyd24-12 bacterium ADurb.Bin004]